MKNSFAFRMAVIWSTFLFVVAIQIVAFGGSPVVFKGGLVTSAAVSPDGKVLATSTLGELKDQGKLQKLVGKIELFDIRSRKLERALLVESP